MVLGGAAQTLSARGREGGFGFIAGQVWQPPWLAILVPPPLAGRTTTGTDSRARRLVPSTQQRGGKARQSSAALGGHPHQPPQLLVFWGTAGEAWSGALVSGCRRRRRSNVCAVSALPLSTVDGIASSILQHFLFRAHECLCAQHVCIYPAILNTLAFFFSECVSRF
ncbi:hypothetical protein PVAP13_3NG196448 [Panicum virgatum]|uniref:Uncharacterized protein n=1 Tax=Panicum virgatum TaxID=38727 RepID=A0A8T0U6A7_PANVG|nr:hypothetical protein PVAP13_3NG196448 [Panicum virgatum]